MNLLRTRFTLRTFMFAIAIVAVNLWGFESFCQAGRGRWVIFLARLRRASSFTG